jgi:hypothetical protein
MNLRAKLVARKPALTPGRTSAWHLSPEEREKSLPRLGEMMVPGRHRFMLLMCIQFWRSELCMKIHHAIYLKLI